MSPLFCFGFASVSTERSWIPRKEEILDPKDPPLLEFHLLSCLTDVPLTRQMSSIIAGFSAATEPSKNYAKGAQKGTFISYEERAAESGGQEVLYG